MTMPTDGQNGAMFVTTKDVWQELVKLRADVAVIAGNAAAVPDHETRIRGLERWRYALPTTLFLSFTSLGTAIAEVLVHK